MGYPLVSAVVLCYNHEKFVGECLEGVKAQDYPNLELIVNDDASQDGSVRVIETWLARSGIPHRLLTSETNQGLCRSLNRALSHARGKYISGIAADDVWLSEKLRSQVALMERLPGEVGVVYSDALQMDEEGRVLEKRFLETYGRFDQPPTGNIQLALWKDNFIPAMTTLVKRDCYDQVGLFDEALCYEDWDMWLRISRRFEFAFAQEISAKYRIVSNSMMQSQKQRILDSACQVCAKHLKGNQLSPEARGAAIAQLHRKAIATFSCGTPAHRRNLMQALRYGLAVRTAMRLLFACCGLRANHFKRLRSFFARPKPQATV